MPTITFTYAWTYQVQANGKSTGVLTVTGTTNYAADGIALADVTETVTVTDPSGAVHTITINPSVSRSGSMAIPSQQDGNVMSGTYGLLMTSVVVGGTLPGPYPSDSVDSEYCPTAINPVLTMSLDCVCMTVTATDETAWSTNGYTVVSRSITLTPPVYPSIWSPINTTTDSYVSSAGFDLYKGEYTAVMALVVSKNSITYTFNVRGTVSADCKTICELYCALDTFLGKIQATTNASQIPQMQTAFNFALAMAVMAAQSMSCDGDVSIYTTAFYNTLKPYGINENCDCDCCEGDDVLQPRCGVGSGTSYTFFASPSQYLTVTTVGNNVTYALTTAAVNLLNAVRVYTISSTDGSVSYTTTAGVSPGSTTNTDLSVAITQLLSFTVTKVANAAPTISNVKRVGTKFNNAPVITEMSILGIPYYFRITAFLTNTATTFKAVANLSLVDPATGYGLFNGVFGLQEKMRVNLSHNGIASPASNTELYFGFVTADNPTGAWGSNWVDQNTLAKEVDEYRFDVIITE